MGSFFKPKQPRQETTRPDFVTNALQNLFAGAQGLFDSGGPQVFEGDRVADFNPDQLQAFDLLRQFALGGGQQFADQALAGSSFFLNPENIFNPENIPGLQAVNQGVIDDTTRALREDILPGIEDDFVGSGQLGSSRDAIARGTAGGRAADGIAQAIAGNNFGAFSQGLDTFIRTLGLAPQTAQLGLLPGQVLADVGLTGQQQQQAELQALMDMFNETERRPYENLGFFADIINAGGNQAGSTTTSFAGRPSMFSQALGIGSKLGSLFTGGAAGGGGSGGGSVGGGK